MQSHTLEQQQVQCPSQIFELISVSDEVHKWNGENTSSGWIPLDVAHLKDIAHCERRASAKTLVSTWERVLKANAQLTHHSLSSSPSTMITSPSVKVSSSGLSATHL